MQPANRSNYFDFSTLPRDLFNEIIQNRSYPDIIQLCLSNKQLKSMCSNPRARDLIAERKREYDNLQKFLATVNPQYKPFEEALSEGRADLLDELFRQGYDVYDSSLKINAASDLNILKKLLEYPQFNTPKQIKDFFISSINPQDSASFLYLLNTRNIPLQWKQEALNRAVEYQSPGRPDIVDALLREPLIIINQTTFRNAVGSGNINIIRKILSDPKMPNQIFTISDSDLHRLAVFSQLGIPHRPTSFYQIVRIPQIWNSLNQSQQARILDRSFEEEMESYWDH